MRICVGLWIVILAFALSGCSEKSDAPAGITKVSIALNWKPEPEFGGIYAARLVGAFAKHGLEVDIQPVGDKAKSLVINGQAEFGIAAADEIISARNEGIDIVGVYTIYQTNPQGIMAHVARGFKDIGDVLSHDGTLAVEPGLHYADYFKQKFKDIKVDLVPYDYAIGKFLNDAKYSQQCFVTSEPILAKKQGSDPQVFLIADTGYNPYAGVVIVSGDYAKKNPKIVAAMTAALRDGWRAYLDDPKTANDVMNKLNPAMDLETFAAAAEAQRPLIETELTRKNGLGAMTAERWETLGKQLVELKQIPKAPPAAECFVEVKELMGR